MSRQACKIIINGGLRALSEALEEILTNPNINGGKIPDGIRYDLIDRQARCDIALMHGGEMPEGGLVGIAKELENCGVLSPDIWSVFAERPLEEE